MAENRGGYRPTAPQNNPANISATGGNGQSGTQPARYISGMGYGKGQEMMQQQQSAPMAGSTPTPIATAPSTPVARTVVPFDAPSAYPERSVTYGADVDPTTPGSEILNLPPAVPQDADDGVRMIQALYLQNPRNQDLRRIIESLTNEGRI